jgi:hypothetical protein
MKKKEEKTAAAFCLEPSFILHPSLGWRGPWAEVAEPLGQKQETPVQPPLHGLGDDA